MDTDWNCEERQKSSTKNRLENVLRFGIEYVGKYKNTSNTFIDIPVEDIDKKEVEKG